MAFKKHQNLLSLNSHYNSRSVTLHREEHSRLYLRRSMTVFSRMLSKIGRWLHGHIPNVHNASCSFHWRTLEQPYLYERKFMWSKNMIKAEVIATTCWQRLLMMKLTIQSSVTMERRSLTYNTVSQHAFKPLTWIAFVMWKFVHMLVCLCVFLNAIRRKSLIG